MDNWKQRSKGMTCATCIWFKEKEAVEDGTRPIIGRCRKHAPTLNGWPVIYTSDWCGDHKLDENKL
jgi:hypothetical protein